MGIIIVKSIQNWKKRAAKIQQSSNFDGYITRNETICSGVLHNTDLQEQTQNLDYDTILSQILLISTM